MLLGFGRHVSPLSTDSSQISSIISSAGGWDDVIQRKVAAATTHKRLGTSCAIRLLATINNIQKGWVVIALCHLYPSGSSIVVEDCGQIPGVQTTISINLLPAAPELSDIPGGVCQTGESSIHDWQNGCMGNWCNYRKYGFIIPRPVPYKLLNIVFTHPLPSNVGIHIGDVKDKWLYNEICRGIASHLYWWRPVTQGSFFIIFCIYTSSEGTNDASWRWNT